MQKNLLTALAALCFAFASTAQAPTTGLVAYWRMNGNFTDAGPNGINCTNIGATATTNNVGAVNTAMAFVNPYSTSPNMVNQYATHPTNSLLSFAAGASFTLSFNVYLNSPYTGPGGLYDNNLNAYGYGAFFWQNPFPQVIFNWRNASVLTTNGAIQLATWVNVCCVVTTTATSIYVNGILNATNTTLGTQVPAYPLAGRFGAMSFSGFTAPNNYNGFNGKIDECRIYNRALSAAEIATLSSVALPVKLNNFTATKNNDDVQLKWQTEYEHNSSHFNVQRSTDGINFTNIGTVQAKATISTATNYSFTDDNATATLNGAKTIYYRLQQADKDGRSELSSIVTVKNQTAAAMLSILQNPAINELRLQIAIKQQQPVQLNITNAQGQNVTTKQFTLQQGETFTALPINKLAAGTYYVSIIAGTQKQTISFIKQ